MTTILPLLFLCACNLVVGAYVLHRAPTVAANRSLSFLASAVFLWTLGIALIHHTDFSSLASTRLTFAAATLMLLALLCVFSTFPNRVSLAPDIVTTICIAAGGAIGLVSLTPLLVADAWRDDVGLHVHYGPLHPILGLYAAACLVWGVRVLIPRYRAATGIVRLQFRYFVTGLLVPSAGITITNVILPFITRSPYYGQYGPYFGLLFILSTAHALMRYRLLDIHLVLRHSVSTALATLAATAVVAASLVAVLTFLGWSTTALSLPVFIIASTAAATAFQPLHRLITHLLAIYAYRGTDDYRKTLRSVSEQLRTILDPDMLSTFLVTSLLRATRAESVGLYLDQHHAFHLHAFSAAPHFDRSPPLDRLPSTSPIPTFLARHHAPLVVDELPDHPSLQTLGELSAGPWAVFMPLVTESHLVGIIAVGPKLSGDPYFADDIDLLSTITNQSAIALTNANLYKDVVLSHEYVQNVLATIESGVVAVTPDHNVTLFNAAAERLTGLTASHIIGARAAALPQPLAALLESTIGLERPRLHEETPLLTFDHRVLPVVCSTSVLRDHDDHVLGAVLVFSDLTQVKELDAAKRRAERFASFTALASGIAHEIKNPLVAIRTFAELLPERFTDEDFRHGFSTLVVREITRIDNLVRRLRTLAVPPPPHLSPIDLRHPIADTLILLGAELLQKNITVTTDYEPGLPLIAGDYDQLKQLFLNLLLNAIDAIGDHGAISIRVASRGDSFHRSLAAELSDTGRGISPRLLGQIFDPFVTSKANGSGLGLAICRSICDSHGASIQVGNLEAGVGARVSLEFPVAATPMPTGVLQPID